MCNFMRTLLTIFSILIFAKSFGQITIDPTVKKQYDSAYKKLPIKERQSIEKLQNELLKSYNQLSPKAKQYVSYSPLTVAVVTLHHIDTLNKDQVKSDAYFYQEEKYQIMFCEGGIISDTFGIVLYPGVAQDSRLNIAHLIINDTVKSEYDQWEEYDTTFRTNLQEEKTNDLTLPFTTSKFVLSDKKFVIGKTIYGYADIISEPYYKDDESFKTGYIVRRLHFRYYFKFVVKKNST